MKKAISLLLVLTMLLASVSSCSENTEADTETENRNQTTANEQPSAEEDIITAEEPEELPDNLPEKDFDGKDFMIAAINEERSNYFFVEEFNGDVVNDAVRSANVKVMDRFNSNIVPVLNEQLGTLIRDCTASNDHAFDIATFHDIESGNISLEGCYRDIAAVPYIDMSKPWWPAYSVDSLMVGGSMYLFTNYISYQGIANTNAVYMNKDMASDYGIEVPYETVRNGEWTLDVFTSMMENIYVDNNGNGVRDIDDTFGFACNSSLWGIQESFGITPIKEDENGQLYLAMNDERTYSLYEKYYHMMCETEGGFLNNDGTRFSEGKELFQFASVGASRWMRELEFEYAFLPMPKLDELQENYFSGCCDRPFGISITSTDDEFLGIMVEAMSAEGYKQIRPAFFDVALKQKFASDKESAEMLQIIGDTTIMDFSYIYSNYDNFSWALMKLIDVNKPSADFASYYSRNEKPNLKKIEKLQGQFDALKNR